MKSVYILIILITSTSISIQAKSIDMLLNTDQRIANSSLENDIFVDILCTDELDCKSNLNTEIYSILEIKNQEVEVASATLLIFAGVVGVGCVIGVSGGFILRSLSYAGENPDPNEGFGLVRSALVGAFGTLYTVSLFNPVLPSTVLIGLPAAACAGGGQLAADKTHGIFSRLFK